MGTPSPSSYACATCNAEYRIDAFLRAKSGRTPVLWQGSDGNIRCLACKLDDDVPLMQTESKPPPRNYPPPTTPRVRAQPRIVTPPATGNKRAQPRWTPPPSGKPSADKYHRTKNAVRSDLPLDSEALPIGPPVGVMDSPFDPYDELADVLWSAMVEAFVSSRAAETYIPDHARLRDLRNRWNALASQGVSSIVDA